MPPLSCSSNINICDCTGRTVQSILYSLASSQSSMATAYILSAPQLPPPRVAKERGGPSDELRYTLDSYEPSQVLTSQDNSYATVVNSQHISTQGYSSGYVTCSIDPKTLEQPLELQNTALYDSQEEVQRKDNTRGASLIREESISLQHGYGGHVEAEFDSLWKSADHLQHYHDDRQAHQSTTATRPLATIMRQLQEVHPSLCGLLKNADKHLHRGQLVKAAQYLERCIPQSNEFPRLQALVSILLGGVYMQLKQHKKSSDNYLRYLTYCRKVQDFKGVTSTECKLGISYTKQGLLQLAARCFIQYLENSKLLHDDVGVAAACSNLGTLSKLLATQSYRASLKDGLREQAGESLRTNLYRAVAYFEQHIDIMEHYGDLEKQSHSYGNLGSCYEMLRQYTHAVFCHNKRLEIVRFVGDKVSECYTLCHLGNCFRATGKLQEAMEYYHFSYEMSQMVECYQVEMVALLNLGISCELTNNLHKAIEWHTLYLSMAVQHGDSRAEVRGFSTLAALYEETGQTVKAQNYYSKLADVMKGLGDNDASLRAIKHLAIVQRKQLNKKRKSDRSRRPHTITTAGGHCHTPFHATPERTASKRNKMGSWPLQKQPKQLVAAPIDSAVCYSSRVVFENPAAILLQEHYSGQEESEAEEWSSPASHTTEERLSPTDSTLYFPYTYNSQDTSSEEMDDPRYIPIKRGRFRGSPQPPPLPPRQFSDSELSTNNGSYADPESTTDYESIPSITPHTHRPSCPVPHRESPSNQCSSVTSTTSSGVWDELEDLTQSSCVGSDTSCGGSNNSCGGSDTSCEGSEEEEEEDKEWEQWINLRDVNSALCRVVSMTSGQIRKRRDNNIKPPHSAPHSIPHIIPPRENNETLSQCTESSLPS